MVELDPGHFGTASYTISGNEQFLKGHFPGNPLWPGVIMIEAIAQLGGVVAQSDPAHAALEDLRLTAVKNAKILGSAPPGAVLSIRSSVEGRLGKMIQIKGSVSTGGTTIAEATVMLSGD